MIHNLQALVATAFIIAIAYNIITIADHFR